MVKQGPIPAFAHGLFEYIGGIALIALPLVLGYDSGAATAASIVLGVLVIFLTATTTWGTSLINSVPLPVHILLDYALAAVLIASPFLFSFSDESTPTAVFIAAGVLQLLVSIGTRYRKDEAPPRRRGRRDKGRERQSRPDRAVRDDEIPEFEPTRAPRTPPDEG
jgi:hypothetical protein